MGYSPWGPKESDTTERLHFHFSLSCIGEGNGNPLQCSCLENPRDGGAWWAAVYGVTQSRTRLKRLSSSSSSSRMKTTLHNVKRDEKAENSIPDEGTKYKTPEKQLNEVEIGKLPEKEFRIMIVKKIQDLGKRMEAKIEKIQEMFTKDLEELKNKQTEMKNTLLLLSRFSHVRLYMTP